MEYLIEILPFEPHHQPDIDILLASIAWEFEENIFSPSYKKIAELHGLPGRYYWVATTDSRVAGTVGVIVAADGYCVLKAMFVEKVFRGTLYEIAARLLQTAINRSLELKCTEMYLGTMQQFKAAQKFYEKNGFEHINEGELPAGYPGNNMDTVFYRRKI